MAAKWRWRATPSLCLRGFSLNPQHDCQRLPTPNRAAWLDFRPLPCGRAGFIGPAAVGWAFALCNWHLDVRCACENAPDWAAKGGLRAAGSALMGTCVHALLRTTGAAGDHFIAHSPYGNPNNPVRIDAVRGPCKPSASSMSGGHREIS